MMRPTVAARLLVVGTVAVLALTGCSGGGKGGGGTDSGPPAGGWPQPVDGQFTAEMCGLLRPGDFEQAGHHVLTELEYQGPATQNPSGHWLSCIAVGSDSLGLVLQPSAEAAEIYFAGTEKQRAGSLEGEGQASVLAEDVVPSADESWFDYWLRAPSTQYADYELVARRGALLVDIVIAGVPAEEADPKGTAAALAGLVLERIPDVGTTDPGTTPVVDLTVTGTGTAERISYYVDDQVELTDVPLPWKASVPTADYGDIQRSFTLNAQLPIASIHTLVGCSISVNGRVLIDKNEPGFVICNGFGTTSE